MARTSVLSFAALIILTLAGCAKHPETVRISGVDGRYSISYHAQSRVNLDSILQDASRSSSQMGPTQEVLTEISGVWSVAPLKKSEDPSVYVIRLNDVKVSVTSDGKSASGIEGVESQLSQVFFAKLTPKGRVAGVLFGPTWGGNARDIAKTLLSMSQFVGPESSTAGENWSTEEEYFGGKYSVKYAVSETDDQKFTITKERTSASAARSTKGMMASHRDPTGNLTCDVSKATGIVDAMAGGWDHSIYVGENKVGTESVKFDLRRLGSVDSASDPDQLATYAAKEPWHSLSEFSIPPDQKLALAKQALGTSTKDSLLKIVAGLKGADGSSADFGESRTQLAALFQVDPSASRSFVKVVSGTGPNDAAFQLVLGSLLRAGDNEAQSSLVSIAAGSKDHDVRGVIVSSLAEIEQPSNELVKFVTEQTTLGDKKLAHASWMSLGVLSSALAKYKAPAAEELVAQIRREWTACKNPADRAMLVLAVGNSGSPSVFPAIRTSLGSKDMGERRAAVQALAKFPGAAGLALLKDRALRDESAVIRAVAVGQMRWQEYGAELQSILVDILEKDPDASVRIAVLRFLQNRTLSPELASVLHRIASADASEEARKAAKALVG